MIIKGPVLYNAASAVPANSTASQGSDLTDPAWTQMQGAFMQGTTNRDSVAIVSKPTLQAGLAIVSARLGSNGQVQIVYANCTGAGIIPTAEIMQVAIII